MDRLIQEAWTHQSTQNWREAASCWWEIVTIYRARGDDRSADIASDFAALFDRYADRADGRAVS